MSCVVGVEVHWRGMSRQRTHPKQEATERDLMGVHFRAAAKVLKSRFSEVLYSGAGCRSCNCSVCVCLCKHMWCVCMYKHMWCVCVY